MAENPPTEARLAHDADQEPLGCRVGAIRCGHQQAARSRRASSAHVAAEGAVHGGEPDAALQRAVRERRAVGQRNGRLQHGERWCREPEVADAHQVRGKQVATPHPHTRSRSWRTSAGDGHLDLVRRTVEQAVPVGGSGTGHGRLVSRPEGRGAHPGLVGQAVATDEVHGRVQPLPEALARTSLDGGRRETAADGLPEGDDAGLPGDEVVE
jgi:hypothetical protein